MTNYILDTDVLVKIGQFDHSQINLGLVLSAIPGILNIHEYVLENEVKFFTKTKLQLDKLVIDNKIKVIDLSKLTSSEKEDYDNTIELLKNEFPNGKRKRENLGEIFSLSYAYVKNWIYMISDDKTAAMVAKNTLQYLDTTYVQLIRLRDVLLMVKESNLGIERKDLKNLYVSQAKGYMKISKERYERELKKLKRDFDLNIWPIEE